MNFVKELPDDPDYCDIIDIDTWYQEVKNGMFTDYDGNGHWVKDNMITSGWGDNVCSLTAIAEAKKEGVTHVCWFNK